MSSGSASTIRLELVDEAALPDPRDADERHELRRARVTRAVEGVLEDARARARVRPAPSAPRARCRRRSRRARRDRLPDGDRLGLALRLDRARRPRSRWRDRVARYVVSSVMTPLTGAALCSRAAVFTTSPDAMPSPASGRASSDTSASPVVIPTRSSSPSSIAKSRIASAARTARSGSSSCAVGAPNSAMTASPMNFSTVPPWRSSSARTRSWYGRRSASTSSGSIDSARAVKPTRSQKTTVTTLRSRRDVPPAMGGRV